MGVAGLATGHERSGLVALVLGGLAVKGTRSPGQIRFLAIVATAAAFLVIVFLLVPAHT